MSGVVGVSMRDYICVCVCVCVCVCGEGKSKVGYHIYVCHDVSVLSTT
jgi:hypothetical protein